MNEDQFYIFERDGEVKIVLTENIDSNLLNLGFEPLSITGACINGN